MPEEGLTIISNRSGKAPKRKMPTPRNRVIPASSTNNLERKTRLIGGDSEDLEQDQPPTIILEKQNDQIAKIIVKCPCGRHSELVCEYDDE